MSAGGAQQYFVIPFSTQKEGDFYLIGNSDMGDFYQIPEPGLRILNMLDSGETATTIKSRLAAEYPEMVDVDDFVSQLTSIGFIHPEEQRESVQGQLEATKQDRRRTFSVDPRVAKAIFSPPALACFVGIILYTLLSAIKDPGLRINFSAFYTETNRTALLLLVLMLSVIQVALHESGHMLAAARHGIKSKYGIANRLWTIVAESDLTGILTLPKSQRYFPMLAGLLVDVLSASLLTVLIQVLRRYGASAFTIQVVQALVLDIVISIPWQFNIFVKTDIYFVICNYFGHPDLDRDARIYLRDLIYRTTFGLFGSKAAALNFRNLNVLRLFSLIWLVGRILSLMVMFGVFIPTMAKYIASAVHLLKGPPTSLWEACDLISYASVTLTLLGIGMYMWFKNR
jgi:putative peptide zinc metalloprotease protein